MQRRGLASRLYNTAWLLVVITLCVLVGTWGSTFGRTIGSLSPAEETITSPRAGNGVAAVMPAIVTDYTRDGTATPAALCAQLYPTPAVVTVETPDGTVLEVLHCGTLSSPAAGDRARSSTGSAKAGQCLYVESPDGGQTVLNATTGWLLSEVEAAHCTK